MATSNCFTLLFLIASLPMLEIGSRSTSEQSGDAEPHIELSIVNSETTGRPLFRCSLRNDTQAILKLADRYDSETIRLVSQHGHQKLVLRERKPEAAGQVLLQPGESRVLFEQSLDAVLLDLLTSPEESVDSPWYWDWTARPRAPKTPFHTGWDSNGLNKSASFWVELEHAAGVVCESNRVTLELGFFVRANESPK